MTSTQILTLTVITIAIALYVIYRKLYVKPNISPSGVIYDKYNEVSGTVKVLAGIALGWAFGATMSEVDSLTANFDDIVKVFDMFVLAVIAIYDEIKSLVNKGKAVTAVLVLFTTISFSQDSTWIKVERPISNPFIEVVKLNKTDYQSQSFSLDAWGIVKQLGSMIFSEDIRHSLAKEISPKCKEYENNLIEDGKKYRLLMANYVDALQTQGK